VPTAGSASLSVGVTSAPYIRFSGRSEPRWQLIDGVRPDEGEPFGVSMSRRKVATTVYITREQDQALKLLAERTGSSVAQYIREGIDLALEAHRAEMPHQLSLMGGGDEDTNAA
jgi:hypothetical protein